MFSRILTFLSLFTILSVSTLFSTETFLDTLNRGKEISLAPFPATGKLSAVKTEVTTREQAKPKEVPNGFRIQILASKSMYAIKKKKTELEENIMLPLYISFNDPYYKLLAGNFISREKADRELEKIKSAGYSDAWVVSCEVLK